MIKLTWLDIFFISMAIISFIINIIQFIKITPIYNSLCGLMNDCRTKAKYYYENIHKDEINKKIVADLDGFDQQIYGILKNIREKDKTFCAYSFTQEAKIKK